MYPGQIQSKYTKNPIRLSLKICSKWATRLTAEVLTIMLHLLTILYVVNRIVSIFCRCRQVPDAESEDQKGKVPPPPGSHDARAPWVKRE